MGLSLGSWELRLQAYASIREKAFFLDVSATAGLPVSNRKKGQGLCGNASYRLDG